MILNVDQIKSILRGVIRAERDGEYIALYRFGKTGAAHYAETTAASGLLDKSKAASSINFDFITDSNSFDFTYEASPGSSRSYYYFDVYIDGVFVEHFGEEKMWLKGGRIHINVSKYATEPGALSYGEGQHRVNVWFPNLACIKLKEVTLDDGASFASTPADKNILAFGDSITQGYDAHFSSLSYVNRIARHFNANLINQGVASEKFVPQILADDLGFSPDIITIAYGTNDWSKRTSDEFDAGCDNFISKVSNLYPDAKRFVLLPVWRRDCKRIPVAFGGTMAEARSRIKATAEKYGCFVIDCWNFIPHTVDFYNSADGIHPVDIGFAEYANGVISAMEKELTNKS